MGLTAFSAYIYRSKILAKGLIFKKIYNPLKIKIYSNFFEMQNSKNQR